MITNLDKDKALTESMLSTHYSEKGVVVKTKKYALSILRNKGFKFMGGVYRNKVGKIARVYPLRNAHLDKHWPYKPVSYYSKGFLISFGGEPKSCYALKFSRIVEG